MSTHNILIISVSLKTPHDATDAPTSIASVVKASKC